MILERQIPHVKQFIKFGIVGAGNTVIDFSLYFLATREFGLSRHILIAATISWLGAVCFSFSMNKFWTFRSRRIDVIHYEYIKFFIVSLVSLLLQLTTLYILSHAMHDLLAKLFSIGVVVFWNFFMNKFWTFRSRS